MKRTYSELIRIRDFNERILYLQTDGIVGTETFGGNRILNQILYKSPEWRSTRRKIILRDDGCDLAHDDYPIGGRIYIHHIDPITEEDIYTRRYKIFDPENLVSVSFDTHQIIHWGGHSDSYYRDFVERRPNDTCPWKGDYDYEKR